MKFPKEKTVRDPVYLAWIRAQPCVFCGSAPPNEASHHGLRGMGLKASDHEAVPACRRCHQRHHDKGSPAPKLDGLTREERREVYWKIATVLRVRYLNQKE